MQENLVIVESPAKAKTIEKFLGENFIVRSSFGHIRDLAKKDLGIHVDQGFAPIYEIPADKKKVVSELSKLAQTKTVWLASDEDREGEAIAWHLTEVLDLPIEKTKRIVFHEITKKAILEAIEKPRTVDMNLVHAQQARRVLDRLVGFELSPVLWKKVRPSLSAGRVQSVAVRLIVEREREIIAFQSTPYFRVVAQLYSPNDPEKSLFKAELSKRFDTEAEAQAFLEGCKEASFKVIRAEEKPAQRYPAPPFTTSTLQQEAGRKLGMSVSQTMSVAQHLYEQGLITYMRTDSVNLSVQALAQCKEEITKLFGESYHRWFNYKTKSKGAQEAHEAIRPTYVELRPEDVKASLTRDQFNLYKLVYLRFVACQMADALYETQQIEIASDNGVILRASGEKLKFAGFTAIYEEGKDEQDEEKISAKLMDVSEGAQAKVEQTGATQHFTQAPPRYTEASLVRALEEKGIGRPSTYAPTISTILARGYVMREKKQLFPTELGVMITDVMKEYFSDIVDIAFTAGMEQQLDEVEEGELDWRAVLTEFYGPFEKTLKNAEEHIEKIEIKDEESDVVCDKCGAMMVYKLGRFGRFLACPNFPECRNTKAIQIEIAAPCPTCGGKLLEKTSKKGRKFYGCEKYPECDFVSWEMPVEQKCPKCGSYMVFKRGRKGETYHVCANETCRERIEVQTEEE